MNNLTLKPAVHADADTLVSMISELYAHEDLPCDEFTMRRNVRALIDGGNLGQVLMIEDANRVIGYAIIVYFFSLEHGGLTALLDEFFILEECRGNGLGNIALNQLFAFCENKGLSAVQLEVLNENVHAKNLYLKKGFEVRDRSLMVRPLGTQEELRKAS
ncbi:MAG: GNAT family N-acetyltransferase [Candidatus Melainabacteria bacterium]|nr:GNAT family N-acetyltransferase [Candidatus Melainabacteria bacterium]